MEFVAPIESVLRRAAEQRLSHSTQVEIANTALNYHYAKVKSLIIASYIEPSKENKECVVRLSDYADKEKEKAEKMLKESFSHHDDAMMDFCLRLDAIDRAQPITGDSEDTQNLFFNVG